MLNLLLNNEANVHAYDDYALCMASENGQTDVVKLLLERGANIHADDDVALHGARRNGHTDIVELLKQYKKRSKEDVEYSLSLGVKGLKWLRKEKKLFNENNSKVFRRSADKYVIGQREELLKELIIQDALELYNLQE